MKVIFKLAIFYAYKNLTAITMRFFHVEVTCVIDDSEYCKDGYVVLGTRKRLDLDANLLR